MKPDSKCVGTLCKNQSFVAPVAACLKCDAGIKFRRSVPRAWVKVQKKYLAIHHISLYLCGRLFIQACVAASVNSVVFLSSAQGARGGDVQSDGGDSAGGRRCSRDPFSRPVSHQVISHHTDGRTRVTSPAADHKTLSCQPISDCSSVWVILNVTSMSEGVATVHKPKSTQLGLRCCEEG